LRGIPGVAVSLTEGREYSAAARVAARLVARVLRARPAACRQGRGVLLNLNVPPRPKPGVRLTCLGRRVYPEDVAVRRGRNGRMHARIGGYPVRGDGTLGTDTRAIDDGYASLSVLTLDFTQHDARRRFRALLAALDGTRGAAKEVRR
jgi:5'-nucleotidase